MDEQIVDVLTKPLARVKFEYFREKLDVLQIEVQGEVTSLEAILMSKSEVRADPFCHGERIGSFHVRYEC